MEKRDADSDMMRWTRYFMSNRSVNLVKDGYIYEGTADKTWVPQGSPVSPILFALCLSRVFREVEQEVEW